MGKAIKLTTLRKTTKNNEFVKSINGQSYKADGPTKGDGFVKSINGQGCKADSLRKMTG